MREIARRFNERFGEILVEPDHRIPEIGARIMDLQDPTSKMSTTGGSEQGTVYVLDEPAAIEKKFRSAVTDSGQGIVRGEGKEGIANLIEILSVIRGLEPSGVEEEFASAGYGDFKSAVAEATSEFLAPVRERYSEIRPDETALDEVLSAGAERAAEMASVVLDDARAAMGLGPGSG
jgi:tryptophanyl-tRNA synthetase